MVKRSRDDSTSSFSESASPEPRSSTSTGSPTSTAERFTPPPAKYTQLDRSFICPPESTAMRCFLPPHPQGISFSSYEEYDRHYAKAHVNRCIDCRKNFPTEHYLGLHIEENHDPLNEVRKARGEKTYSCFVEDCDRKCSTPQKRRMHLVDKHMFPKNYDFFIINDGIDKRSSLLRSRPGHRRHSSAATRSAQIEQQVRGRDSHVEGMSAAATNSVAEGDQHQSNGLHSEVDRLDSDSLESNRCRTGGQQRAPSSPKGLPRVNKTDSNTNDAADADMANLTTSMSTLKFIPPSVRFGRGKGTRKGLSRR